MSLSKEILYGDVASVNRYLLRGEDVNIIDEYGFTPLIETAIEDNIDMARLVIQAGADVNLQDSTGNTALHWAVENHNLPFCKLLLDHKANPNAYSFASQPVLVKALLRNQQDLKQLLYQHGADLVFAQDFINTKLIGHRFELIGNVDLIDTEGNFTEVDFEGFFLEFTLGVIQNSLENYKNNFAARKLRHYFNDLQQVIHTFAVASELIKYQQYRVDIKRHSAIIEKLLRTDLLLLPVGYEGHAITYIKYADFLGKCDRGEMSQYEDSVTVYDVNNPYILTSEFMKDLIYKKQTKEYIVNSIPQLLGLEKLTNLHVESQLSGNCSWANVEAAVPTMLFLLAYLREPDGDILKIRNKALAFYHKWREWDKNRALHFCINSFKIADPLRKASKAAVMGAILFQRCDYTVPQDLERAQKILSVIKDTEYEYVLKAYVKAHLQDRYTESGENYLSLLKACKFPYEGLFK